MSHRPETIPLPKLEYWELKNKFICVIGAMPQVPLTCFDFWCKAGSAFEEPGEEGLAHFLEHMVFKGSANLKAGEFDQKIEALGGSSNAATGYDDVHFHVLVPKESALIALDLLLSLVLEPTIHNEDFALEKEVVLEEIAQYNDQPDEVVFQTLLKNCWSNHAYGRPILGIEESLIEMSTDKMKSFHKRRYKPENYCLAITGPIPINLRDYLNKRLDRETINISNIVSEEEYIKHLNFKVGRNVIKIPRLESDRIIMAWPIPPAKEQLLMMGVEIATSFLAEGRNSKLVQKLREEMQLVESIDIGITLLEKGSLIVLEAICKEGNVNSVEDEINKLLLNNINTEPLKKDIKKASQQVKNSIIFSLETSYQLAGLAGVKGLWNRREPLQDQFEYINYWTASKIQKEILILMNPKLSNTLIAKPLI